MAKKRTSIWIESNLWDQLEQAKSESGISISFNIEKALRKLLEEKK